MATIAVDLDDVIAANAKGWVAYSNKHWGTSLDPEDYHEHWSEIWRVEQEEADRRAVHFHESRTVSAYEPFKEALPVLESLKQANKLIITTSRRITIRDETQAWIELHFPNIFSDIHFAGMWDEWTKNSHVMTKKELCERVGADYLIDDQLKHCFAVAEVGLKAILFGDYGWNKCETLPVGVVRKLSWVEIGEYFGA
jgi:uncharacterized HAD superfamily protein